MTDAAQVAQALGAALEAGGYDYALGGAIALGYWGEPRGTVGVDLTLFLSVEQRDRCVEALQAIGCELDGAKALDALREHGFCQARYRGVRVDVFLPIVPFYEKARGRRARVQIGEQSIMVWGPEALAVFKMMFFVVRTSPTASRSSASKGSGWTGLGFAPTSMRCMASATRVSPPGTS